MSEAVPPGSAAELVSQYLRGLQARITTAIGALDGTPFVTDA